MTDESIFTMLFFLGFFVGAFLVAGFGWLGKLLEKTRLEYELEKLREEGEKK